MHSPSTGRQVKRSRLCGAHVARYECGSEDVSPRRWQFSIGQMLIATAMLAAVCGMSLLAVRFYKDNNSLGLAIAVFAIPVLLTGTAAVFSRSRIEPLLQGVFAGLFLACVASQSKLWFELSPVPLLALIVLHFVYATRHTSEQVSRRRQVWVFCLSAAACGLVLLMWLPLIPDARGQNDLLFHGGYFDRRNCLADYLVGHCHRNQTDFLDVAVRGLIAIIVARLPIAVYARSRNGYCCRFTLPNFNYGA